MNVDWLCLCLSHLTGRINVVIVIGRNNGVVGLTAISNKRMCGLLFGPQKNGRIKGVVVWRGSTVSLWKGGGGRFPKDPTLLTEIAVINDNLFCNMTEPDFSISRPVGSYWPQRE